MKPENFPTSIIIFGATGDLSRRKLITALFDLYSKGYLPEVFRIIGFSRGSMTDQEFRKFMREVIDEKKHGHTEREVSAFLEKACYLTGLFEDALSYQKLAEKLIDLDNESGQCSNKLFYLAVPPAFYGVIFKNLAESGLSIPCSSDTGWTRVLVEKPFGKDFATAQELDKTLGLLFREEQIFRIDHYLAKETLQNILAFRFSNALFEPIWNNKHIEKVEVKLYETAGAEERGVFYDDVGALRDVGQNHVLQMLAIICMENPGVLAAGAIRKERSKVLDSLRPISSKGLEKYTARGQYKGFVSEKGVKTDSETETYFRIEAHLDNERWRGVPFYLESGKRMKESKTELSVYFKKTESCLCPPEAEQHHQNILIFTLQPDEGISIVFWVKKPGFQMQLESKELSFKYKDSESMKKLPDAYERVLVDVIRGDQTLFTSTEEVEASWRFITPILENWNKIELHEYESGFKGL